MRRGVSSIMVALGLLVADLTLGATTAQAGPAGQAVPGRAPATGQKVCTVTDARLRELSGLVATKSGYVVINDSSDLATRNRVFFLDGKCRVVKAVKYSGDGPRDTEDLALSADGKMLWIADIGDNKAKRPSVALWSMPVDGSKEPVLHRLGYPQQKAYDAEALLMADNNTPIIITKTIGKAQVFTPAAALKTDNTEPVPMKQVGEVTLPKTATENPLQAAGRVTITGATRSADGTTVVLRTYADAFEYDVAGGDIVKAVTTGTPRVTPLADPFGEAISYTADGAGFVTVSDAGTLDDTVEVSILSYTPATAPTEVAESAAKPASSKSLLGSLSLPDIMYLIGAVGLLGAILVGAGIFGILRSRRRSARGGGGAPADRQSTSAASPPPPVVPDRGGHGDYDNDGWVQPQSGERRSGADRGGERRSAGGMYGGAQETGGVYGGGRPADGGVYGGGQGSGSTYGGGAGGRGRRDDDPSNGHQRGGPNGPRRSPQRQPPRSGGYGDDYR